MLCDVNTLFVFKSILTMPNNVLPLHLKQIYPLIIWIFTEGPGYILKLFLLLRIKIRLKLKLISMSNLPTPSWSLRLRTEENLGKYFAWSLPLANSGKVIGRSLRSIGSSLDDFSFPFPLPFKRDRIQLKTYQDLNFQHTVFERLKANYNRGTLSSCAHHLLSKEFHCNIGMKGAIWKLFSYLFEDFYIAIFLKVWKQIVKLGLSKAWQMYFKIYTTINT